MADIGKLLAATKLQLGILIILGLIRVGLSYLSITDINNKMGFTTQLPIFYATLGLIAFLVVIWAGYKAAKVVKGSGIDGAVAGFAVSLISSIIAGVLDIIVLIQVSTKMQGANVGLSYAIALVLVGIIAAALIGFILGAIGGFIGRD